VYGSWRQKDSLDFELPSLSDVLAEFFMNLANYGFLLPDVNCEYYVNTYGWIFYIKNKLKQVEGEEGYYLIE